MSKFSITGQHPTTEGPSPILPSYIKKFGCSLLWYVPKLICIWIRSLFETISEVLPWLRVDVCTACSTIATNMFLLFMIYGSLSSITIFMQILFCYFQHYYWGDWMCWAQRKVYCKGSNMQAATCPFAPSVLAVTPSLTHPEGSAILSLILFWTPCNFITN